jgi:hypothetical protein
MTTPPATRTFQRSRAIRWPSVYRNVGMAQTAPKRHIRVLHSTDLSGVG